MKIYIQIGANVGGDDFQTIIANLLEPSRVVLIEPNGDLHPSLSQSYKEMGNKHEIIILPYAISVTNGTERFYQYPNDQHSSLLNRKSCSPPGITVKNVNALTFSELCRKYNIVDIECLFIDTEGMDYEILNSIELSEVNIRTIYFEEWAYDDDDRNNKYRSGPRFLDRVIRPKFKDYKWEFLPNNIRGYKLTKKADKLPAEIKKELYEGCISDRNVL